MQAEDTDASSSPSVAQEIEPHPVFGRRAILGILVAVFAINYMDRQILAILAEPIKRELNLSDTKVGLLYGFAFVVLYTTAGIPIARFADRASRARIINWSLVLFSLMTAACGLAMSYWQFLATRIGVGIGEGGTNPPSHSMISDLYPVNRRSTAMAIFSLGPHIGILLGFLTGGWIAQFWGWRAAFVVAGVIGLLCAALSFRFLQEPARGRMDGAGVVEPPQIRAVVRALFRHASIPHLFAGGAISTMTGYAVIGWLPSFLIRSHGLSTGAAGSALALILGLVGGAGTCLGGLIADRLGERHASWRLRIVAIACVVMTPFWILALMTTNTTVTLMLLVLPGALLGFYLGPTFAMVQSLVDPAMRAAAAALLLLVGNLVGLGLGPLAVGALSDALKPELGPNSLRMALMIIPPICLWAAYHFYAASRTIDVDLATAVRR